MPLTRGVGRVRASPMDGADAMTNEPTPQGPTRQGDRIWNTLRIAGWVGGTLLLAAPLAAMHFGVEGVNWTGSDFLIAGVMIYGTGLLLELGFSLSRNNAYRLGMGLALGTALLMTWANLAVGIIGNENDPANLMFWGVILVLMFGAVFARFRPRGMALALAATAAAQVLVGVVAALDGHFTLIFTGVFTALWLGAAQLFRAAAGQQRAG